MCGAPRGVLGLLCFVGTCHVTARAAAVAGVDGRPTLSQLKWKPEGKRTNCLLLPRDGNLSWNIRRKPCMVWRRLTGLRAPPPKWNVWLYKNLRICIIMFPSLQDFIDLTLSKTQRKTPTVIHKHYQIHRIRHFYMRKVKYTQQNYHDRLTQILTDFPKLDVSVLSFDHKGPLLSQYQEYFLNSILVLVEFILAWATFCWFTV